MRRPLTTFLAAAALALGGVVATGTTATAAEVACPGGSILAAYQNAQSRGSVVDEYFLNRTGVVVYRVDGRYEAYVTNGASVARACYNAPPPRPAGARDRWSEGGRENTSGGLSTGGGGLSAGGWGSGSRTVSWSITVRIQHD